MAGVVHKKLSNLSLEIENSMITALIVSMTEPNIFLGKDKNEFRGVITFTIRDSKRHLTNCKFWGTKEKVEEYNRKYNINDIIDVICPRIVAQPNGNNLPEELQQQQRFQPLITTPFFLVLNEGNGFIEKHSGDVEICRGLWELARISHKPMSAALNLADIRSNDKNNQGQFVDLLVAVVNLRPVKEIRKSKSGQTSKCLELIVFDRSVRGGMMLTIWNNNWIKRAQLFWLPMKTILHLIDVRVGYSEFFKTTVLNFTSKSLIYENPLGKESKELLQFVETVSVSDLDILPLGGSDGLPNAELITTVMTVKQIYARAEGSLQDNSEQFTAVLIAMITKFDIDGLRSVVGRKCNSCYRLINGDQDVCEFDQCQMSFSFNFTGEKFDYYFNINIQLSDHTGTLIETRLNSTVAERILAINVNDFRNLNDKQKEELKWRFLMEQFKVKLVVKKKTAVRKNLSILVVDMHKITLEEVSKQIVAY